VSPGASNSCGFWCALETTSQRAARPSWHFPQNRSRLLLLALLDDLYEPDNVPLGEGLWLHPHQFVLGTTLEFIRIPLTCAAYVLGRSSWGRLGLLVATAVMIQPGFSGAITLELENVGESPIKLYPGLKIAQLAVHSLPDETQYPYRKKYLSPTGPQASRLIGKQDEPTKVKKLGDALRTP
jgi:deoxycytidine triphosphate deaminase